ncbi:hypothetical protein [Pseudonocardia spinosispora]|uniref:hypothetical protein n=1 Tax=Pseudonocardia spinosispora TaxID=103441 RepID=UPI000421463C|nr:hypothetical protein [Pseudonocardia spinosispora]
MTIVTRRGLPLHRSPVVLAAGTIVLGVAAHVLGGGGGAVESLPLLMATTFGVATTLAARRVAGRTCRGAAGAAALLGIGQFGMHLALSVSVSNHFDPITEHSSQQHILGLSCGLVLAHTLTTALLVVLVLGAHRSAELALRLLSHTPRVPRLLMVLMPRRSDRQFVAVTPSPELTTAALLVAQRLHNGPVGPRRGPPRVFATR